MLIDLYAVPLLVGFIIAWISTALIFFRGIRTSRYSDLLFSALLIATSFLLLEYMFGYMGINILWQELLFFPYETTLLLGPLFYLYFRSQVDTEFKIRAKQWLHFLPYALYFVYHVLIYAQGQDYVREYIDGGGLITYIDLMASFISNMIYFYLTLRFYRAYKKWLINEMPEGSSFSFRWFSLVLIVILLSMIVMWSFTFINLLGFPLDYQHNVWQYILLSAILVALSFEGYAQKQPMYLNFRPDEIKAESNVTADEINSDSEESNRLALIKSKILELMNDKKLYLNTDISLSAFAAETNYSKSDISTCINSEFSKNFSQFVNEYRVKEVCEALERGDHNRYSLLGIAMNAGFNSKATFNRVFKESTKKTPMQYAKAL